VGREEEREGVKWGGEGREGRGGEGSGAGEKGRERLSPQC